MQEREVLLAHCLNISREQVLAHDEQLLKPATYQKYLSLLARREKGEPFAYLFGKQEFYGHSFAVSSATLIPRPETEWLVERALEIIQREPIKTVIDVGTGSGCILLSVYLSLTPKQHKAIQFIGIEASPDALAIAKKNAKRLMATGVKFIESDLLEDRKLPTEDCKLILANLPYLTTKDYQEAPREVRNFEPRQALWAGPDGLKYYRELVHQLAQQSHDGTTYCVWEIDPCHSRELAQLVEEKLPARRVIIEKDFTKKDRYLEFVIKR